MFPHPLKKVCLFIRLRLCECVINPRRCWEWPVWVDQCPSGSGIISLDLLTAITAQVLTRQHSSTAVVSACHISFSLYVSKTVSAIQDPLSLNLCQRQLVNWNFCNKNNKKDMSVGRYYRFQIRCNHWCIWSLQLSEKIFFILISNCWPTDLLLILIYTCKIH